MRTLEHSPVVLHMSWLVGLSYIFQFWLFEFCLLDKILINIGEVLWSRNILAYLAAWHDLQGSPLMQ